MSLAVERGASTILTPRDFGAEDGTRFSTIVLDLIDLLDPPSFCPELSHVVQRGRQLLQALQSLLLSSWDSACSNMPPPDSCESQRLLYARKLAEIEVMDSLDPETRHCDHQQTVLRALRRLAVFCGNLGPFLRPNLDAMHSRLLSPSLACQLVPKMDSHWHWIHTYVEAMLQLGDFWACRGSATKYEETFPLP